MTTIAIRKKDEDNLMLDLLTKYLNQVNYSGDSRFKYGEAKFFGEVDIQIIPKYYHIEIKLIKKNRDYIITDDHYTMDIPFEIGNHIINIYKIMSIRKKLKVNEEVL